MMWALRRTSNPLKNCGLGVGASRVCCAKPEVTRCSTEDCPRIASNGFKPLTRFNVMVCASQTLFIGRQSFASQAGTKSSSSGEEEDNDFEDGFSELEVPTPATAAEESSMQDDLVSEANLSEEEGSDDDVEEGPENELDNGLDDAESEKMDQKRRGSSALFYAIVAGRGLSVDKVMDQWIADGKELARADIAQAMLDLRRRTMYGRALQLSEWVQSKNVLDFTERDYVSRIDLIAKVRGLQRAEKYIQNIPKPFRTEVIYRTLLANCVAATDVKKAEELFNTMKDLEFPVTSFACNQLLLLYKRTDKKKIADVLLLMEKENIKPTLFTYRLLIDTKGQSNDITGMEQIFETMKAEGIEPDLRTRALLARHYVSAGLKEKAEKLLEEMEGSNMKNNPGACQALLPLYAALGKSDDVGRLWKICESNPHLEQCMAAIEAWGKLKNIDQAEAVFDTMLKKYPKVSSKHYSVLLKVYINHKMLTKGKDLIKRMADSGCHIGPLTWDALVKLYVEAGEVEKADSILQKAAEQNRLRPMFSSYMVLMDQYAKRGDVHNAEKIFHRMRKVGYVSRLRQFQALIQAYINANVPAYGINERMRADNIFPNKALAGQLAQVDAFRKTAVSDLLD